MTPHPRHYGVILADPPWTFATYSTKGKGRSAEAHYNVMDLDAIKALPMADWAAQHCVLFLWGINSMLPQALAVIEAWGFTYKTIGFCWAKRTPGDNSWHFGLGYWTRQNTESCLLATRGRPARHSRAVPQLLIASRRLHSQKPDEVYERIERLSPGPYLELFARRQRLGWDSWGNEVDAGPSPRRWRSDAYAELPSAVRQHPQ
jgi:N6-adenosine-specific RNA methylase IME4